MCDAHARAYLKCITGHTGYWSCERCISKGETFENGTVFVEVDAPKHSHESFRSKTQEEHHKEKSPLIRDLFFLDMVYDFPLEYMHPGCLGDAKKLAEQWFKKGSKHLKLSAGLFESVSSKLL